jgi:hypothetical protein
MQLLQMLICGWHATAQCTMPQEASKQLRLEASLLYTAGAPHLLTNFHCTCALQGQQQQTQRSGADEHTVHMHILARSGVHAQPASHGPALLYEY